MTAFSLRKGITLSALVLVAVTACGGDDNENPTGINVVSTDPAIQVILPASSFTLLRGTSVQVTVLIDRANFSGTVTSTGDSLPSGVTSSTLTLAAGETTGVVTLTASGSAPTGPNQFFIKSDAPGAATKRNVILVAVTAPPS